jgi:hypothetical protein
METDTKGIGAMTKGAGMEHNIIMTAYMLGVGKMIVDMEKEYLLTIAGVVTKATGHPI